MDINVGDIVKLKKGHPCGSHEWEVLRIGGKFMQADGKQNAGLFCDGLHPNAAGYEVYARELETMLPMGHTN